MQSRPQETTDLILRALTERQVALIVFALALGTFAIGTGEFGSNGVIQLGSQVRMGHKRVWRLLRRLGVRARTVVDNLNARPQRPIDRILSGHGSELTSLLSDTVGVADDNGRHGGDCTAH